MREPPRRRGAKRPCEQIMMSRQQWRRPSSMRPGKASTAAGALLVVGSFSEEEEDLLIKLHALLGNRWSLIAGRLPGRTGEEVKTYWDSQMRTKLKRMGIDPVNRRVHPEEWEEHRAKHPAGHSPASSEDDDIDADAAGGDDDCAVSDAGSSNRARAELNQELTFSMPCASSLEIERTGGAATN